MSKFIIEGGKALNGTIRVSGNKNAALPIICATILSEKKITLRNVPKISDVKVLLRILKSMGTKIKYEDKGHTLIIDNSNFSPKQLDKSLVGKFRGSILLVGPMLAKFKKVETWMPGGCNLGNRSIDPGLNSLEQIGAQVKVSEWIDVDGSKIGGAYVWQEYASVTGTENIIMAATLSSGTTTIYNAACEPHIQDLCNFLNMLGADIKGIGSNLLTINGVSELLGGEWNIINDHMEIANFMSAALMTKGEIRIKDALKKHMFMITNEFGKLGLKIDWDKEDMIIKSNQQLKVKKILDGKIDQIDSNIWPDFPTDILQYMVVNATQAEGQIIIHEKVFENRMFFFEQLNQMGANIIMCDPHRLVITGPTPLKGTNLVALDIRGGGALVMAALGARGKSIIDHAELIDRGYDDYEIKLRSLGADITRGK